MEQLLFKIVQMSGQASIVIGVVLVARLCLRKFPKKYTYMLWFVVGFRLLCPFQIKSGISLFNLFPAKKVAQTTGVQSPYVMKQLQLPVMQGNGKVMQGAVSQAQAGTSNVGAVLAKLLLIIWIVGVVMIIAYTIFKYVKLVKYLRGAKQIENGIYESPLISVPFVFGIRNPKIYLPVHIEEQEKKYLILHERVHIQYGDYFMKCIGFVATAVHWFNPLVWLAYLLYSKDVEMRCDEVVIDKMGNCIKQDYSMSLVSYALKKKNMTYVVMPLSFSNKGFGGLEVKMRIKNILSYKKASKIAAALAIVSVAGVTVFCASNAKEAGKKEVYSEPVSEETLQYTEEGLSEEVSASSMDASANQADEVYAESVEDKQEEVLAEENSESEQVNDSEYDKEYGLDLDEETAMKAITAEKEKLEAEGYIVKFSEDIVGSLDFVDKEGGNNSLSGSATYMDEEAYEYQKECMKTDTYLSNVTFTRVDEHTEIGEATDWNGMPYEIKYDYDNQVMITIMHLPAGAKG